jgi:hypothetical protein
VARTNDWMTKEDRGLLAARKNEWLKWWEKTRSRGMLRFILVRYVLVLGGTLAGLEVILHLNWLNGAHALYMFGGIAFTLLTGCLLGLWEWYSNERRYRHW